MFTLASLCRRGVCASSLFSAPNVDPAAAVLTTADAIVLRVRKAQAVYASFDQETVDRIVENVAQASAAARIPLAQLALDETGRGILEDKVIKNHFSAENVLRIRLTLCFESTQFVFLCHLLRLQ